MLRVFALALALSVSLAALANDTPAAQSAPVVIKDIPKFIAHQQALRADMQNSKKFSHVDAEAKRHLYAAQDQLFGVLKGKKSIDELSKDELVTVYNAENEIAAILQNAEYDRPICERTPRLGSHFDETRCLSKRQREQQRLETRTRMLDPQTCQDKTCMGGG